MKKIRGDKPIGVIIHVYMEISQGNSLCSYLYLKIQRTGGWNKSCTAGRAGTSGSGEVLGKKNECGAIKCVHMSVNAEMTPVKSGEER
jgi:hypothetical protein